MCDDFRLAYLVVSQDFKFNNLKKNLSYLILSQKYFFSLNYVLLNR